jgi:polyphosphate glucokinase
MKILGIDVGGTGIKGAPVDTQCGRLLAERHRIPTPQPATPKAVAQTVADIVAHFGWTGPIGRAIPAVVQQGVVRTAANISKTWLGKSASELFEQATGHPVTVIKDAEAAGYAEMHIGAGRGHAGLVSIVTLGTIVKLGDCSPARPRSHTCGHFRKATAAGFTARQRGHSSHDRRA